MLPETVIMNIISVTKKTVIGMLFMKLLSTSVEIISFITEKSYLSFIYNYNLMNTNNKHFSKV